MKKNWYEEWFSNKHYLELYSHRNEKEARDLINLIQRNTSIESGSSVLDVCCGAGRHSIEMARRGYNVTGIDLSRYLISEAKKTLKKADETGLKARFLIRDMKNFSFGNKFDAAINVFSSFGYFDKDSDNLKVFENISSSLKKGGCFVFDFLNEKYVRKALVPYSEEMHDGMKIVLKRRVTDGFVVKEIIIGKKIYTERIRLYSAKEIRSMLKNSGFRIVNYFGDYTGSGFSGTNSKRLIIISRKI
ncbi:MAG TPA: class I SAM-dependent methyltransferase [Ignavibacteria bacterium]|nr:class I SAM-dependent methyltransferase [Ignavibacteria bacterium]